MRGFSTGPTNMKRIVKEYREKLYAHKFNNLDKIGAKI